jgi:oligosaccharide repeat unit polymerase
VPGASNLIIYAGMLLVTLLVYQVKRKTFDSGSALLGSYFLYSVCSIALYQIQYYPFKEPTFLPFLYLYCMLMIAFYPVLRFRDTDVDAISRPSHALLIPLCLVFMAAAFVQLPKTISAFSENIVILLFLPTGGLDLYNEAMSDSYAIGDGSIANLPSIITNAFGGFGVLLLFFYLTLERRSLLVTLGLVIACLIVVVQNITLGQRGPIQEALFTFLVTYLLLRKWLSPRVNRLIKFFGIGLIALVAVPLVLLTSSRFGDMGDGVFDSTMFYVGQQNLFFNNHGLDNNGIRYGDRTFPLFKTVLGYENVPSNFMERRDKYPELHINDEVFIGFVGDFVLDFGPALAALIIVVAVGAILLGTRIHRRRILFHQLILLHFALCLTMLGGIKLYPFSDIGGNLQLTLYFVMYAIFWLDHHFLRAGVRNARIRVANDSAVSTEGDSKPMPVLDDRAARSVLVPTHPHPI